MIYCLFDICIMLDVWILVLFDLIFIVILRDIFVWEFYKLKYKNIKSRKYFYSMVFDKIKDM